MKNIRLSRLVYLSWEIQHKKKYSRSKALQSAWAIVLNEDITIHYLVKRHSHSSNSYPNKIKVNELTLFRGV